MVEARTRADRRAATVSQYLASLSPDRRAVIAGVRKVIQRHLPAGYRETMAAGMITYEVPLSRLPETYNGHALWYVALASQKSYCTLHLMATYANGALYRQLEDAFKAAGKRFDMGKACLHFRSLDDLPLDAVGEVIAAVPMEQYVASYEASRKKRQTKRSRSARSARSIAGGKRDISRGPAQHPLHATMRRFDAIVRHRAHHHQGHLLIVEEAAVAWSR